MRTLIRSQDSLAPDTGAGTLDLAARARRLASRPGVTVATPGTPVDLPARPWPSSWRWSAPASTTCPRTSATTRPPGCSWRRSTTGWSSRVRDEGPGIPDGRLEQAAAEGRLGVRESIRGRIADLGGTRDADHRLVRHRVGVRGAAMTIHSRHPFADPEPDEVRRFRGRLGGAVTLWTTGEGAVPRRADGQLADGRERRDRAGAGPGRPRLRLPRRARARTGTLRGAGAVLAATARWPRCSPAPHPRPAARSRTPSGSRRRTVRG